MKQTLLVFFLLSTLCVVGCNTTSRVHLRNRDIITLEITHSTPETIYGINESRTANLTILRSQVADIEFPGNTEIIVGAIATGVGGASSSGASAPRMKPSPRADGMNPSSHWTRPLLFCMMESRCIMALGFQDDFRDPDKKNVGESTHEPKTAHADRRSHGPLPPRGM